MGRRRKYIFSKSQKTLPFSDSRSRSGALSYASLLERRLLMSAFAFMLIAGFSYVYFVMASVVHVATREEASKETARLSAEVARLEASYLARSQEMTESYARGRGFVATKNKIFVEKTSLALSQDTR